MRVTLRPWAELVFHVLAHVKVGSAPSLWDPQYIQWCARTLGPPHKRELAQDITTLTPLLGSFDDLVRTQMLAWLFVDMPEKEAFDNALDELEDVDDPSVLRLLSKYQTAEILWCACALEADTHAKLPWPDTYDIEEGILEMHDVAPTLKDFEIGVIRSLGRRGRVRGNEIWVGDRGMAGSLEHIQWQAAHEATVAELAPKNLPFIEHERAAIALLKERARSAGKSESHARWLSAIRVP